MTARHGARGISPGWLGEFTETGHATAEEAVAAVLGSGFARHLGTQAASWVHRSSKARRAQR